MPERLSARADADMNAAQNKQQHAEQAENLAENFATASEQLEQKLQSGDQQERSPLEHMDAESIADGPEELQDDAQSAINQQPQNYNYSNNVEISYAANYSEHNNEQKALQQNNYLANKHLQQQQENKIDNFVQQYQEAKQIDNNQGGSSPAPNVGPSANNASFSFTEDNTLNLTSAGIISNASASDSDGGSLSVTAVAGGSNGSLVDNGGGSWTYTPNADYNGSDTLTFTLSDGQGGTLTKDINLTINDDTVHSSHTYLASLSDDGLGAINGTAGDDTLLGDTNAQYFLTRRWCKYCSRWCW